MIDIPALFDKYQEEFLIYERPGVRKDLHAFCLIDRLVPGNNDIVDAAEHDQIWLSVEVEKLAAVATEEQMLEIFQCGVFYDEEFESLSMFV